MLYINDGQKLNLVFIFVSYPFHFSSFLYFTCIPRSDVSYSFRLHQRQVDSQQAPEGDNDRSAAWRSQVHPEPPDLHSNTSRTGRETDNTQNVVIDIEANLDPSRGHERNSVRSSGFSASNLFLSHSQFSEHHVSNSGAFAVESTSSANTASGLETPEDAFAAAPEAEPLLPTRPADVAPAARDNGNASDTASDDGTNANANR